MWFRNIQLYRLEHEFAYSPEDLEVRLQGQSFQECPSMDLSVSGWVSPLGRHSEQLVHAISGFTMICARKAEKILPASVIRDLVDDKVAEIEAAEMRDVRRRERNRIKDEIVIDLLPRALTRNRDTFAYFDIKNNFLVVDSSSPAKAEELITLLRHTLGTFPVVPVKLQHAPADFMTRWVSGEAMPEGFQLGEDCQLKHPNPEGGIVTCKGQDLTATEIHSHIKTGKFVTRLALTWEERVSFVMNEDLSLKSVKPEDLIKESMEDVEADDAASKFDLDFSLMTLEFARFIPELLSAFGGEENAAKKAA